MHYNITTYLQWTYLLVPSILQCTVLIIVSKLEKKYLIVSTQSNFLHYKLGHIYSKRSWRL